MPELFSVSAFRFSVGDLSTAIGKWSRVATFGAKSKDGTDMVFDATTLGQMVENAASRGDKIAICQDHLSAYVSQTGQPAPALGYFTALAVVYAGNVVKAWNGQPADAATLDDGLYAMLGEITPRGADPRDGLANYAFLSPMFSHKATNEAGDAIGFALFDVAATNTPFQSGTEIQFTKSTAAPGRTTLGANMDDEMSKRFGFEPDDDDEKKKEKMSKFWADHDAAMAKLSAAKEAAGDAMMSAKLSAFEASNKALLSRLSAVEAAEQAREASAAAAKDREVKELVEAAIAGGYPAEAKEAFTTFARTDMEAAKKLAAPHLKGAPASLFGRLSAGGAPVGQGAESRKESGRAITMTKTPLGTAFSPDEEVAEEIQRLAMSAVEADKIKIDSLMSAHERTQPWARLIVAERVLRKERPEMFERAERLALGLGQ